MFLPFIALSLFFHLLRFPYLVLNHGGGAFLILFFLLIYLLSFPLLVAESVIEKKIKKNNLASFMNSKQNQGCKLLKAFVFYLYFCV